MPRKGQMLDLVNDAIGTGDANSVPGFSRLNPERIQVCATCESPAILVNLSQNFSVHKWSTY